MAIIIKTGKSNTEDAIENGKFAFFDRSQIIKKSNNFLFNGEYIIVAGEGNFTPKFFKGKFDLHQRAYCIESDESTVFIKYLFYFLKKNEYEFNKYSVGSTVPSLRLSSFDWIINKNNWPNLEEQKIIIDIIEPNKEIFLKYSNCVRIDSEITTKNDMKKIIDIIEPLEKKLNILSKINENLVSLIHALPIKQLDEKNIFDQILTGKKNANVASKEGKYNFYTAGKKILKTDNYSFDGKYILISGNGELYNWFYEGKFDAYQRVYVLKEKKDFYTTHLSVQRGLKELRQRSNGAVIKFIKLDDLKNISKYDNKFEKELKILYELETLISKMIKIIEKNIFLFVKLLIK